MLIEFLTSSYGWDEGYETEVLEEDKDSYFFEDMRNRYSSINKSLENADFILKK